MGLFIRVFALTFSVFLFLSQASAQQCVDIFGGEAVVSQPMGDLSYARFEKTIDRKDPSLLTPLEREWLKQIGKPLSWFKNLFGKNNETHQSVLVARDQSFAVSKSSTGVFRVYDAAKKELSELALPKPLGDGQAEVVATFPGRVVIGIEEASARARDQMYHLDGFYPHELVLYDLSGNVLNTFFSDLRIKGSELTLDQRFWINADQEGLYWTEVGSKNAEVSVNLYDAINKALPDVEATVNAIRLSRAGDRLFIALSERKGSQAAILALDASVLPRVEVVGIAPVADIYRIYGLDETSEGSLRVTVRTSDRNDDLTDVEVSLTP